MLLIFNASPEERGLIPSRNEAGATLYYFPADYAETVPYLLAEQKEKANVSPGLKKEVQE